MCKYSTVRHGQVPLLGLADKRGNEKKSGVSSDQIRSYRWVLWTAGEQAIKSKGREGPLLGLQHERGLWLMDIRREDCTARRAGGRVEVVAGRGCWSSRSRWRRDRVGKGLFDEFWVWRETRGRDNRRGRIGRINNSSAGTPNYPGTIVPS